MTADILEVKIVMMGPSRIGKTTLITAIIDEMTAFLQGTIVSIAPADGTTKRRVSANRRQLEGELLAGEFSGGALAGTEQVTEYRVRIAAGEESAVDLLFMDFPGALLDPNGRHGPSEEAEWLRVEEFMKDATSMIVPSDSVVLMEAKTGRQRGNWSWLLDLADVADAARTWAKGRLEQPDQPAMFLLAPVKCETYFADNGGQGPDLSERLFGVATAAYEEVIAAVRGNAEHAQMIFAPVDSVGCVEVERVVWDDHGPTVIYMTRGQPGEPVRRRPKGAEDVVRRVLQPVIDVLVADADNATESARAQHRQEIQERDQRGFFKRAWEWITTEDSKRKRKIASLGTEADKQAHHAEELRRALVRLGEEPLSTRVRGL